LEFLESFILLDKGISSTVNNITIALSSR